MLGSQEFGHVVRRRCGIVATDRHQQLHSVADKEIEVEPFGKILFARPETAHVQVGTALGKDRIGQQVVNLDRIGRLREESLVAVVQADHPIAVRQKSLGHTADHRIDAGCGTSAGQYCYRIFHGIP